jgi:hypothetical protein
VKADIRSIFVIGEMRKINISIERRKMASSGESGGEDWRLAWQRGRKLA